MAPNEREERLRRAGRARLEGRLDLAIAEFEELVASHPDDMSLLNTLGDLHVSHGQPSPALPLFLKVGDHFFHEGFYSKAAGIYRKILKFVPRDESMIVRLAEALAAQGLNVEARAQFNLVESARRRRGDLRGAEDVALRVSDLDPTDLAARWSAARALAQRGDVAAIGRYEDLATDFERQLRFDEALAVWHEVIALTPADAVRRERAARRAWARGDAPSARIFLANDDLPPHGASLALLAEIELRAGTLDGIRSVTGAWLDFDGAAQADILHLVSQVGATDPDRAWACVAVATDRALSAGVAADAEHALRTFLSTGVLHGPALVRWVEVAVLAHLDEAIEPIRDRLRALPRTSESPVTALAVIQAAARRVSPHGPWVGLFDEFLGHPPRDMERERRPDDEETELVFSDVEPDVDDDAAALTLEADGEFPIALPTAVAPEAEFVEVDLTAALNAISVHDVQPAGMMAEEQAPGDGGRVNGLAAAGPALVSEADAGAALTQGQTYLAAGLIDQAREALTQALDAPHTALRAAQALVEILEDEGQAGEACRVLERVLPLATGRDRGQVLALLVVSLEHAGDAPRARQRLGELADAAPDHPLVRARRERRESPGR